VDTPVALLVALIAATVALVGIIDRQRADNRHRFTDRKQALYTDLWIECDRHRQQVASQLAWRTTGRTGKGPTVGSTETAERTVLALDLLAPRAVRLAAHSLFGVTAGLGARFAREDDDPWRPDADEWDAAIAIWTTRAKDYLDLAKTDLRDPG
jgi:hypothetical protein